MFNVKVTNSRGVVVAEARTADAARYALHFLPPGIYDIAGADHQGDAADRCSVDHSEGMVIVYCGLGRKKWHLGSTPPYDFDPEGQWGKEVRFV